MSSDLPHPALPSILCGAMALAACSPASEKSAEEPAESAVVQTPAADDCLLMVWSGEADPDIEFDRANDAVTGGAISCATGASPSRFEAAISALRDAASSRDKVRILEQLGIPLLYIDENGDQQDLGEEQVEALFDDIFDDRMLEMLQRLDLSQMTVEKDQGAFFELGSPWLVVDETGQPRVVTVNRQALVEAAAAARDEADLGQGRAID